MALIHLHGILAARFGDRLELDVATPAEAIAAICANFPQARAILRDGEWRLVLGAPGAGGRDLDVALLRFPLGQADLHILPAAAGAKQGGPIKTIIGVTLLIATVVLAPEATPAVAGEEGAFLGVDWGASVIPGILNVADVAKIGAVMVTAGAAQWLTPTPKTPAAADRKDSFLVGGTVNITGEGGGAPLAYGRPLCGVVVLSAGITTQELDPDAAPGPADLAAPVVTATLLSGPPRVSLSWGAVAGAGKYGLWRSADPALQSVTYAGRALTQGDLYPYAARATTAALTGGQVAVLQGTSYVDTAVVSGGTYAYRLRSGAAFAAVDPTATDDWGPLSEPVTVTVP